MISPSVIKRFAADPKTATESSDLESCVKQAAPPTQTSAKKELKREFNIYTSVSIHESIIAYISHTNCVELQSISDESSSLNGIVLDLKSPVLGVEWSQVNWKLAVVIIDGISIFRFIPPTSSTQRKTPGLKLSLKPTMNFILPGSNILSWSPCGKFLVAGYGNSTAITIIDAVTSEVVSCGVGMTLCAFNQPASKFLKFSENGEWLYQGLSHSNEIVIWETFSWTRTKLVTKSALSSLTHFPGTKLVAFTLEGLDGIHQVQMDGDATNIMMIYAPTISIVENVRGILPNQLGSLLAGVYDGYVQIFSVTRNPLPLLTFKSKIEIGDGKLGGICWSSSNEVVILLDGKVLIYNF